MDKIKKRQNNKASCKSSRYFKVGYCRYLILFVIALLLFLSVNGCKRRTVIDVVPRGGNNQTEVEAGISIKRFEITMPFGKNKHRQIRIMAEKGDSSTDGVHTMEGVTAELKENGVTVAIITADHCKGETISDTAVATLTGNISIKAINARQEAEVITDEVEWRSDSNILRIKKFTVNFGSKGTLTAFDGEISTDLKKFDFKNPKLEMQK